ISFTAWCIFHTAQFMSLVAFVGSSLSMVLVMNGCWASTMQICGFLSNYSTDTGLVRRTGDKMIAVFCGLGKSEAHQTLLIDIHQDVELCGRPPSVLYGWWGWVNGYLFVVLKGIHQDVELCGRPSSVLYGWWG
ncbi:9379_t:CDS:2, partial [Gigaspora rosea]